MAAYCCLLFIYIVVVEAIHNVLPPRLALVVVLHTHTLKRRPWSVEKKKNYISILFFVFPLLCRHVAKATDSSG